MNVLFVCSRNKWRSRTAETIFKNSPNHTVKSAGTEATARIKITEKMIGWADIIFAMEKKHKQRLNEKFPLAMVGKQIVILDIPDEFRYMDDELIDSIKTLVSEFIEIDFGN